MFCCRILTCLLVVGRGCAETSRVEVNTTEGGSVQLDCTTQAGAELPDNWKLLWSREGSGLGETEYLGTYLAGRAYSALSAKDRIVPARSRSRQFTFSGEDTGSAVKFTLFLNSVTTTEDRRYNCSYLCEDHGCGTGDGQTVAAYALNVLGPPRDTHLSTKFTVAEEGEKVRLVCTAAGKPAPQYTWIDKNGRELPSEHGVAEFVAELDVAGIVSCKAYNELGTDRATASIVVRFKPKIVTSEYVPFKIGMPLRLVCSYASIPEGIAVWLRDGAVVSAEPSSFRTERRALPEKDSWELVVKKDRAVSEDAGIYTCHANNSLGSTAVSTLVTDRAFNTSIDVISVESTSVRLLLTTYCVAEVTFYLNITAVNSSLLLDRQGQFVPGLWAASGVVTAAATEPHLDEVKAHKVQNNYVLLGLRPATHYHMELKVLLRAEFVVSPHNAQLSDIDADSVGVSASVDLVTREAASLASSEKAAPGGKPETHGASRPAQPNDGRLFDDAQQQREAQPAGSVSAASSSAAASTAAWFLLPSQLLLLSTLLRQRLVPASWTTPVG